MLEQRVKAAQALKPAGKSNLGGRHRGVGQQTLGEQQALRLRKRDRRHAELRFEHAAQMPIRYLELRRDMCKTIAGSHAVFNQTRRGLRQTLRGIDTGITGRQLRPATQAGTKSRAFRSSGTGEETAILTLGHSRGTHRPAINPRRRNTGEKPAIESRIVTFNGLVAAIGIEHHGVIMRRRCCTHSPFSDMLVR